MSNIMTAKPLARLFFIALISAGIFPNSHSLADTLPAPTGTVILTITGSIENRNTPSGAEFDYEMLAELGLVSERIHTEWTQNGALFEGIRLSELMNAVGAKGHWVRARAANDYSVNIPMADLTDFDTLLGLSLNGQRMQLRDKGPSWILYSNKNRPDVRESELNRRMIWQLTSLLVM